MRDLSRLKLAIGQIQIVEGRPSKNEDAIGHMVEHALAAGADALLVPNSLVDENDVRILGLNDSRIDVVGSTIELDTCTETYTIGIGRDRKDCDLSVYCDLDPFTISPTKSRIRERQIALRPVGIRDLGKKIISFDGGTSVTGESIEPLCLLDNTFREDFALVDFASGKPAKAAAPASMLDALIHGMRRFDEQALPFMPKWIIGLSGGLDSAITAALLVLAFGSNRVIAYNMATRFNSDTTKSNASSIAQKLNIAMRNGSIEDLVVCLGSALVQYGYAPDALKGVVLENAQARTRGNLLATFAALEDGVVVNNGNRIECALGYATLYGDAIGALAPIADLTKVQLFDLAWQINERMGVEAVPKNLLPKQTPDGLIWQTRPSAELANGQYDPMKWFYHDWLISRLQGDDGGSARSIPEAACEIMERYLHARLLDTPVGSWIKYYGLDEPRLFADDLHWIVTSMQRAAFKRVQAPPYLALASPASVRAELGPQAACELGPHYESLMRKIRMSG